MRGIGDLKGRVFITGSDGRLCDRVHDVQHTRVRWERLSPDDLRLHTRTELDLDQVLARDDALSDLLRVLLHWDTDEAFLGEVRKEFRDLCGSPTTWKPAGEIVVRALLNTQKIRWCRR